MAGMAIAWRRDQKQPGPGFMVSRLTAVYRVRTDADSIAARAQAIAVEQSVEMPLAAIDDPAVLSDIVGRVETIADLGDGCFEVRIGLATGTTGFEPGQLLNVIYGNSSIHDDVVLWDVIFPPELLAPFGGPHHGVAGLRDRAGAAGRAVTCSALKPQGLPIPGLAGLAGRMAAGGIDYVKDDHNLADQTYGRFAERVPACAAAVRRANAATGGRTRYVPSVSGDLDRLRRQMALARDEGIDTVMVAPMILGFPTVHTLVRDYPDMAFLAHPTMAGAARIAPPLLFGKLFRLLGADAVIFTNHGGRFGYAPATCRALAETALAEWHGLKPSLPVPAGGMTLDRVPEMLDFYGPDVMLLIGGDLLMARERLTEAAAEFAAAVARHGRA